MSFLIIFLCIFSKRIITQRSNKNFIIELSLNESDDYLYIPNKISSDKILVSQVIDLTSNKTWIDENVIKILPERMGNQTNKITLLYPENKEIYIKSYYDQYIIGNRDNNLENCSLLNFKFYIKEKNELSQIPYKGIFGLAKQFDDDNEDFILQLYKQKKIEYNLFSLSYYKYGKGNLFIGFYHENLIQFHEYVSYIKLDEKDEKWRSELTYIFFGELSKETIPNIDYPKIQYIIRKNIIKISSSAIFSNLSKYIICPLSFLEYLNKINYFKGYCQLKNFNNTTYTFECDINNEKKIYSQVDIINLVFHDIACIFSPSELFEKHKDKMIFIFRSDKKLKDEWILGFYFMKKYMITFFKDLKAISLFSLLDKAYVIIKSDEFNLSNLKTIKFLLLINCIIMYIGIGVLLIYKNNRT